MADDTSRQTYDSGTQHIAGIYAKAYLGAAEDAGMTDAWVLQLDRFTDEVVDRFPGFRQLLDSAFISCEQKEAILARVVDRHDAAELLVFLKVLNRHDRLGWLSAIRREVDRQFRVMRGRVDVTLQAAEPLPADLRRDVVNALRKTLGTEPEITEQTDPALLGGLVVTVGNTVFDGSLSTQLARTREEMIKKCVEEIETNRTRFLTGEVQ
jgi:F-type H+-transporting ATPase subunit delta